MSKRSLDRYAELLGDLRVAAGEQERLGNLLGEIEAWTADEESTCYYVAVYAGRVRGPLTFEAIKRTQRRREGRVTRLLPEKERSTRRFSTDAPVLAVQVTARVAVRKPGKDTVKHRREHRCVLFERPE